VVCLIDVINVQIKIKKKMLKNVKNVDKNRNKRLIKTLPIFAMNPAIIFAH